MSACKSCGAAIRWATTEAGKAMPLDADPADNGNVEVIGTRNGGPLVRVHPPTLLPGGIRYLSHFVTCPQSRDWRKGRAS